MDGQKKYSQVLESNQSDDGWVVFITKNNVVVEEAEIRYYPDHDEANKAFKSLQRNITKAGYNLEAEIQAAKSLDDLFVFLHNKRKFLIRFN